MKPIFFIHVRRTAGATFRKSFEDVVPPQLVFPAKGNCHMTEELWHMAYLYPYIYGHFWLFEWQKYNLPHRFACILRDPVDQQVALWHNTAFRMGIGQDVGTRFAEIVNMGLPDAIMSGAIKAIFDRTLDHVTSDRKNPLPSAKVNMEEMLVGFFDDVESLILNALEYAELPVPAMIEPRHLNAMVDPLDPYLRARLASYLEPDYELYDWAKARFKQD